MLPRPTLVKPNRKFVAIEKAGVPSNHNWAFRKDDKNNESTVNDDNQERPRLFKAAKESEPRLENNSDEMGMFENLDANS